MLLSQIVLLQQQMALIRSLSSKNDKDEIRNEFFTLLAFIAIMGFCVALAVIVLAGEATNLGLIQGDGVAAPLMLAAFLVPFSAFGALTTAYFMATRKFKTYASLTVLSSFGQLTLTLVLLGQGAGLMGIVAAALTMLVVVFLISMALIVSEIGICSPKFKLLKPNLRFGLPLTPGGLIAWVTDSSDRYLVALVLGISMAGIYSAAYGIASVVFLLINPIQIVLYPTISRLYDNNEIEEVKSYLSKSLRYFLMISIPAVAGMAVVAEPLLVSLTTPEFAPGSMVIPLVGLAGLLNGALVILISALYLAKKTHLNLIVFGIPAAANVAMNLALIPLIGIIGAALATTIAYFMMVLIGAYLSFKLIRFSTDWRFILKSIASSLVMVVVIALIDPVSMVQILISIALGLAVYFTSLFLLGGTNSDELSVVRGLVVRGINMVRRPK
jgi:O-antigen/teichoic acid export membrane protein